LCTKHAHGRARAGAETRNGLSGGRNLKQRFGGGGGPTQPPTAMGSEYYPHSIRLQSAFCTAIIIS